MAMRLGRATRRIRHFDGDQRLARQVADDVREVRRDRFVRSLRGGGRRENDGGGAQQGGEQGSGCHEEDSLGSRHTALVASTLKRTRNVISECTIAMASALHIKIDRSARTTLAEQIRAGVL